MKKIIFVFLILLSFTCLNVQAQTTLETQLRNFPIAKYLNKPIDTLIANLPTGYDTAFVISDNGNLYRGATLWINYPNNQFSVDVSITKAQYITVHRKSLKIPPKVAWPLYLLRKERIGSVTIYKFPLIIINEADIY